MDKRIARFIKKHHVCTLATCCNEQPWCASAFYVFLEEEAALVFTSDPATRHTTEGMLNQKVAGTVASETKIIGLIRGVQFSGILVQPEWEVKRKALKAYLKRFPYAVLYNSPLWILKNAPLWVIELHEVKFTDNRLGFGKKLKWRKDQHITF